MLRAGFEAGEAHVTRVISRLVIVQFVQAFLGEDEAALFTCEFKTQLHLAARLNPVGLNGATAAAPEVHKDAGYVIDFDGFRF